jgi:opacity protein-like surface antigen
MKKLILGLLAVAFVSTALSAQVRVRGYQRSDGTYVAPHYRSSPNSTTNDNWTTKGNVNPYTGAAGTRNPEPYSNPYLPKPYAPPCYYNCGK